MFTAILKRQELMRNGFDGPARKIFRQSRRQRKADGNAKKMIEQWFGSYEAWEAEFKRIGNALSGGSAGRSWPLTSTQRNFITTGHRIIR